MIPSQLTSHFMELTKEHFEKLVAGLAGKNDLVSLVTQESFEHTLTKKLAPLATKQDVRDGVEELARLTSAGFLRTEERFNELETRLDVTEQLQAFERKFQKLEEALHIKL
jgi:hypothetical protein